MKNLKEFEMQELCKNDTLLTNGGNAYITIINSLSKPGNGSISIIDIPPTTSPISGSPFTL